MNKPLLLRLHRWTALAFAAPLLAVIASGLVLSVEPGLKAATPTGAVTPARLGAVLDAAGPLAPGTALFVRGYDGTVTIGGRGGGRTFDLATATPAEPGPLPDLFRTARRFHETLLLDLGWLVTASTVALLALAPLGLLLGWPRWRNSIGGWHRTVGWFLLPLLVGSPLTGLAIALRLGAGGPPPAADRGAAVPPPLAEVVRMVAERHDLAGLDWVRPVGGAPLVRVLDASGTAMTYRVGPDGLVPQQRRWARLLHEGSWGGVLGSLANAVTSIALLGLLGTGIVLWGRRTLRKRWARKAARVPLGEAGAA